jgi:uncharacterized membrane protein YbaN (DUF454 family)
VTLAAKRRLLMIAGWVFLVLGVLGLFLPVLQGILFLLVGLILLARAQPRFRLLKQRLRRRYPRYARIFEHAEARAGAIARGEIFGNASGGKRPPTRSDS